MAPASPLPASSSAPSVGVLLLMHAPLAEAFAHVLTHVMGKPPELLIPLSVNAKEDVASINGKVERALQQLDVGAGVMIFTDICGATPYQIAQRFVTPDKVALVCGTSLPMLVRALTYRHDGLVTAVAKALSGASEGTITTVDLPKEENAHAAS